MTVRARDEGRPTFCIFEPGKVSLLTSIRQIYKKWTVRPIGGHGRLIDSWSTAMSAFDRSRMISFVFHGNYILILYRFRDTQRYRSK